mmetsp:Transcript_7068/g.11644  ORF Transcript_7068/g.11644 Transcript_7068/m.11644 type:complete len:237 (-) Transcript_7068:77-787(-)
MVPIRYFDAMRLSYLKDRQEEEVRPGSANFYASSKKRSLRICASFPILHRGVSVFDILPRKLYLLSATTRYPTSLSGLGINCKADAAFATAGELSLAPTRNAAVDSVQKPSSSASSRELRSLASLPAFCSSFFPTSDCNGAKQNFPSGSLSTTMLTHALQKLQTPSNKMTALQLSGTFSNPHCRANNCPVVLVLPLTDELSLVCRTIRPTTRLRKAKGALREETDTTFGPHEIGTE